MVIKPPAAFLSRVPNLARLLARGVLGVIFISLLAGYQPTLKYPPIKQNVVFAQAEQAQSINASSLPFDTQLPHPGYMSTHFSSFHPGIDIATGLGMPIKPIAKGRIVEAGYNFWGLGLIVVIEHSDGYKSTYAHMGKIYVKVGQEVESKDYLGEVGMTGHTSGPHTHLELVKDGKSIDPQALLPTIREMPVAEDFQPVSNKRTEKLDLTKEIKASL